MTDIAIEGARAASAADILRAHQVDTLFGKALPSLLGAAGASVVLAAILWHFDSIDKVNGSLWLLYMMVFFFLRFCSLYLYRRASRDKYSRKSWAYAFTATCLGEGLGWGWASVYLVNGDHVDLEILTAAVVFIVATGAIPAHASYFPALIAVFVPASAPYAILSFVSTDPVLRASAL